MSRLIALLLITLAFPATASAEDVRETYTKLANRNLKPAPLVFTTSPKALRPIQRYLHFSGVPRGYALRMSNDNNAVIALEAGVYKTLAAADRWHTRNGFKRSPTKVRGHKAFLYKRPGNHSLIWSEDGRIYDLGSGTPKKVSLAELRQTANNLERLGIARYGGTPYSDESGHASAFMVTTEKTLSAHLEWGAGCQYAGYNDVVLLPRQGNTFSFPLDDNDWAGTVTGTIGPTSITMSLQGTFTTPYGRFCDTGVQSFTLDQIQD